MKEETEMSFEKLRQNFYGKVDKGWEYEKLLKIKGKKCKFFNNINFYLNLA